MESRAIGAGARICRSRCAACRSSLPEVFSMFWAGPSRPARFPIAGKCLVCLSPDRGEAFAVFLRKPVVPADGPRIGAALWVADPELNLNYKDLCCRQRWTAISAGGKFFLLGLWKCELGLWVGTPSPEGVVGLVAKGWVSKFRSGFVVRCIVSFRGAMVSVERQGQIPREDGGLLFAGGANHPRFF